MLRYYNLLTGWCAPLILCLLTLRRWRGKEDAGRFSERLGRSHYGRPQGQLLWIHAASVGEAHSVLALIRKLRARFPALHLLLTTGTVTSAALMKQRLPAGVIHQFVPVDTPQATERFMRHWQPDIAWFVESELWPNLIDAARRHHCLMALINARMSERSFQRWKKYRTLAHELLSSFQIAFAQTEQDAARLRFLGAKDVWMGGNLKYDAEPLACDETLLLALQQELFGRPCVLAASTHPGEERILADIHTQLRTRFPSLLTILVPRHPQRGSDIAQELSSFGAIGQRSRQDPITPETGLYIADTMGELGLWYRLSEIVCMGGSFVPHGGQNPWEAAQLSCAIICGPHMHNFAQMQRDMQAQSAIRPVADPSELRAVIARWLEDGQERTQYQACAKQFTAQNSGPTHLILDLFAPLFAPYGNT